MTSTTKQMMFMAGLVALAATMSPTSASAQCDPNADLCAAVVGPNGGFVAQVGPGYGPPRRPRRYVVAQPPPPQQVIVVERQAPPPPPMMVAAPPPRPLPPPPPPQRRLSGVGLHLELGGIFGDEVNMGGFAAGVRFRGATSALGLELTLGAYGGEDYNGDDRTQIPFTVSGLLFFNPRSRFQFYGRLGFGVALTSTDYYDDFSDTDFGRSYMQVGGLAGLGVEWRIGARFALNLEARAFIQQAMLPEDDPEFINYETGETTNTSGGVLGTMGMTFYF